VDPVKNWVEIFALEHQLKKERQGKNRAGEIKRLEYRIKLLKGRS
jgi:hypothetical protein